MKDKLIERFGFNKKNLFYVFFKSVLEYLVTRDRLTKFSMLVFLAALTYFNIFQWRVKSREDSSGPEITMETDSITISVKDGEDVLMQGVTAADRKDGDITDSLVVENLSSFTTDSTRTVTYAAFDSDNHVSRVSRKVIYSDYEPPVFHLEKPLQFPANSSNILENLTVTDQIDGDITSSVKFLPQGEFSVEKAGIYQVEFRAVNSAGDVAILNAPVEIYEQGSNRGPVITLTDYLIYLDKGADFDPADYLDTISLGGRTYDIVEGEGNYDMDPRPEGERIVVGDNYIDMDSNVNTSSAGFYTVTYSRTIDAGNEDTVTGSVRLIVIVR